jgi:hypothetical protein
MAVNAKTHLEIERNQSIHLLHIPMACDAVDLLPDVWLVIEFNIIGNIEDSNPGHRCLRIIMPPLQNNLRMLWNNILVAEKTFVHRRDSSILGSSHKGVAETAIDFLYSYVNAMAKKDWLFCSNGSMRIDIVEIEHDHNEKDSY